MNKMYRTNRLGVLAVALALLVLVLFADGIVFYGMKYVFHLDFSQDYRQVDEIGQLRFWDSWSEKVFIRYPFGLRPIEKREDVPEKEKPVFTWLETSVYDVTDSGGLVAWYDWKEDAVYFGNAEGEIQKKFCVIYDVEKLAFSPDGRYLLVYEIDYRGEITDDEYCYYRALDLEDGVWHTVYAGYREWFFVYWEETVR